ncbi:MAG: hypothetical protein M1834_005063 [Cirrosporium novae-zelandiae]|nr:MAG: hypothetical protein M1834_005063 [Cirrosporium novae-zelandiae]
MKFAKELEEELVPEWRAKYFDYKTAKKKVKAVFRAFQNLDETPRVFGRSSRPANLFSPSLHLTKSNGSTRPPIAPSAPTYSSPLRIRKNVDEQSPPQQIAFSGSQPRTSIDGEDETTPRARPMDIPDRQSMARNGSSSTPLSGDASRTKYGSIVSTPPQHVTPRDASTSLELPGPALDLDQEGNRDVPWRNGSPLSREASAKRAMSGIGDAYAVGKTISPSKYGSIRSSSSRHIPPRRIKSHPGDDATATKPRFLQRVLTARSGNGSPFTKDVPLNSYGEFETKRQEFIKFLDKELDKIETFYREKEEEASERLQLLRAQLHQLKNQRMEELLAKEKGKESSKNRSRLDISALDNSKPNGTLDGDAHAHPNAMRWIKPIESAVKSKIDHFGKTSKAMQELGTPSLSAQDRQIDSRRDYERRPETPRIPYRTAKRKLKLALQEFYRGLELLKAYALLNRTAFRKINKKYDKAVYARPTGRYMNEKVKKAWFVQSEVLEGHIVAAEDLYSRYFYRGNHKVAVGKLRSKTLKPGDYTSSVFRNGLMLAAGTLFGVEGIVYGVRLLFDSDPAMTTRTSYLLQWRLFFAGLYPVEFRDFFLGDMFGSETYSMGNIELFFCLYSQHWSSPPQCNSSHSRLLGFFSTLPAIWRFLQCIRRYYDTRNAFPHLVNCGKYSCTILYYMTLSLYRIHKTSELRALFIFLATINSIYSSIWDLMMDWSLGDPNAKHPFLRDVLGYRRIWMYYVAMVIDPILRFNWIFYAIFSNDVQHSALLSFIVALSEAGRRGLWTIFRVENEHCTNVGRFRASREMPLPYEIPCSSNAPTLTRTLQEEDQSSNRTSTMSTTASTVPSPKTRRPRAESRATAPQPPCGGTGTDLERQVSPAALSLRRRLTQTVQEPSPGSPLARGIGRVGQAMWRAHAQDFERKRRPEGAVEDAGMGESDSKSSDEEEEEQQEDAEDFVVEEAAIGRREERRDV